jgi:hypothetical protein
MYAVSGRQMTGVADAVYFKTRTSEAQRMHASGESALTIATTLNVSRATVYRALSGLNDDPSSSAAAVRV